MSAHSLGRASSALRSKRLSDGKTALRRGTAKGALERDALTKGSLLGESGSTII